MEREEINPSPELKKFFDRLLHIKHMIRTLSEKSDDVELKLIYIKLDELIKETE